jgi:large subunit ribosomal protein L1
LEENYKMTYSKIVELCPVGWKGDFLKNITLSTTMGPGLKILK